MSKLGTFLSIFKLAQTILPGALALKGVSPEHIQQITHLTGEAEAALGPGSGPEKLQHVVNGIGDALKAKGADDVTIAGVQGVAVEGINAAFSIAKDVQAVHDAHQPAA
jgi:hypothetical protein